VLLLYQKPGYRRALTRGNFLHFPPSTFPFAVASSISLLSTANSCTSESIAGPSVCHIERICCRCSLLRSSSRDRYQTGRDNPIVDHPTDDIPVHLLMQ
jgi:hypothetical protein